MNKEKINLVNLLWELKYKCILADDDIRTLSNLTHSEYKTILSLSEDEEISAKVLAARMGLSPSRVSRIIERMEEKQLIVYKHDQEDRRRILVALGEQGKEIKKQINKRFEKNNTKILNNFSDSELKIIKDVIIKLLKVL